MFQQFFLLDGLSAVDNVANGLLYSGVAPTERRRRAAEALDRVGLGHRFDHIPSPSERRRAPAGRHRPGDRQPSVDRAGRRTDRQPRLTSGAAVMDLLRELHDEGRTIVVITHDRELAASLPRRISMLDGRA